MAFKEAKEQFGKMLRWDEQGDDSKTVYLGDVIEGLYVSKKDNVGQNESTVYELRLKESFYKDENGLSVVSFWGSALLDGKFKDIPMGSLVRLTYLGKVQPKTPTGRPYHNFKVEYDDTVKNFREAGVGGANTAKPAPTRIQQAQAIEQNTAMSPDEAY